MHRILVEEKRWISEQRFLHALNYCMLLPSQDFAAARNLHRLADAWNGGRPCCWWAIYPPRHHKHHGVELRLCPLGTTVDYHCLALSPKAAVLAIVIEAVIRIGKRALRSRGLIALAVIAFVAIFFFGVPFPLIILAAGLLGLTGLIKTLRHGLRVIIEVLDT